MSDETDPAFQDLLGEFNREAFVDFHEQLDRASVRSNRPPPPLSSFSPYPSAEMLDSADRLLPLKFQQDLSEYRVLFKKLTSFRKAIKTRPFTQQQREYIAKIVSKINTKRAELRKQSAVLGESDTTLPSWTELTRAVESGIQSMTDREICYALGHYNYPVFTTSLGVIHFGNVFFKELFEVTDEILASGSYTGEDLLVADEYPYYVKFVSQLYSGEVTNSGPCAFYTRMVTFKTKREVSGVLTFRPFSLSTGSRKTVCQFIPNVQQSFKELVQRMDDSATESV